MSGKVWAVVGVMLLDSQFSGREFACIVPYHIGDDVAEGRLAVPPCAIKHTEHLFFNTASHGISKEDLHVSSEFGVGEYLGHKAEPIGHVRVRVIVSYRLV